METEKLLSPSEAAAIIGTAPGTLANWRFFNRGPAYVKFNGRVVKYRLSDLLAYIEQNKVQPGGGRE